MKDFNLQSALELSSSNDNFPVEFDLAWEWLGYHDKATAKRALLNCGFVENIEYRINAELPTASVPRPKEIIQLTIDCFKTWGMMAGTEEGKQIRLYFLECEKVARAKTPAALDRIEAVAKIFDLIFANVPVKPELIAGLKLNAAQAIDPNLSEYIEASRQLLIGSTAQEYKLLTVSDIGKQFNLSAQKINQALIDKGLQTKNVNRKSQKEPAYIPTDRGAEFADFTLSTGIANSTTYQQLRWYESVCAFFDDNAAQSLAVKPS